MKLEFSQQILQKYTHNKFHEHPTIGSGRADRHDELIVAFQVFSKAPKN
jgi:hypothetical protein